MVTATIENQQIALGVLIGAASIVIGYVVARVMPKRHFPVLAGVIASNAIIAGLAYWGVDVAGKMVMWWLIITGIFAASAASD